MLNNSKPMSVGYNDGYISHRKSAINQPKKGTLPPMGAIILYNEVIKWRDRKVTLPYRGCGIVCSETRNLLFLDVPITPTCFIKTSFPKTDFILGFIEYVQLKEMIYKKDITYNEMDIHKLKGKIKSLVVDF